MSGNGSLVYTSASPPALRALDWIDRQGRRERLAVEPQTYGYPRVSPDGSRVAVERIARGNRNFDVYSQAADGASDARLEYAGPELEIPDAVTPDGRWIAYESDESGNQFEIILRPFPSVNDRRDVLSVGGGRYPRWGPPGSDELYYLAVDGAMMAVPVRLSPALVIGRPVELFDWATPPQSRSGHPYDVAPDGRFLSITPVSAPSESRTNVSVVLGWLAGIDNARR